MLLTWLPSTWQSALLDLAALMLSIIFCGTETDEELGGARQHVCHEACAAHKVANARNVTRQTRDIFLQQFAHLNCACNVWQAYLSATTLQRGAGAHIDDADRCTNSAGRHGFGLCLNAVVVMSEAHEKRGQKLLRLWLYTTLARYATLPIVGCILIH